MTYKTYRNALFPAEKILAGLKARSFLEPGYISAPYVPLINTPIFEDSARVKRQLRKAGLKVRDRTTKFIHITLPMVKRVLP